MKCNPLCAAVVAVLATIAIAANGEGGPRNEARLVAGDDMVHLYRNFCDDESVGTDDHVPIHSPVRVFDNLIYLGPEKWNSWALTTSEGIILFDALETRDEAENYIVGGLKALNLDPADIRYIVVMHGHGDHFGGARYLQEKFDARVLMSAADWDLVEKTQKATEESTTDEDYAYIDGIKVRKIMPGQEPPRRDRVIEDGTTLTLGDNSVKLHLTPGHTPGTVSALVPLKDGKQRHLGGFWGGTGFSPVRTDLDQYLASLERFATIANAAGVDVAMSNHPTSDMMLVRHSRLENRAAGESHPFVIGTGGYMRLTQILGHCVNAAKNEKE